LESLGPARLAGPTGGRRAGFWHYESLANPIGGGPVAGCKRLAPNLLGTGLFLY